ncbi:MAG: NADPH-dependent oxidoreductase [Clostridia bacterium]|nr:NADPH-dependent oxidoreductase [Clostridia bacterium]
MDHRSIRAYTEQAIPEETIGMILGVVNHTATSNGMQHASIIRVKDPEKKQAISEICRQKYVTGTAEYWVFIVDCYRNAKIGEANGLVAESARDMDRFFQGFTDAALQAQNAAVAIESLGLGCVFFGSILNDAAAIIDVLNLPELTFPVLGLGFGYPDQSPQLKPRMPVELKVFENEYRVLDDYKESLAGYDETMKTYYDLRNTNKKSETFSEQVIKQLMNPMESRANIVNVIRAQGFDLKLK